MGLTSGIRTERYWRCMFTSEGSQLKNCYQPNSNRWESRRLRHQWPEPWQAFLILGGLITLGGTRYRLYHLIPSYIGLNVNSTLYTRDYIASFHERTPLIVAAIIVYSYSKYHTYRYSMSCVNSIVYTQVVKKCNISRLYEPMCKFQSDARYLDSAHHYRISSLGCGGGSYPACCMVKWYGIRLHKQRRNGERPP